MNLGLVLRRFREAMRMQQGQLAEMIGTTVPTISRIENGKQCDADTFMKIMNWLREPESR